LILPKTFKKTETEENIIKDEQDEERYTPMNHPSFIEHYSKSKKLSKTYWNAYKSGKK
jgi:hypothetical protein